MTALHSAAWFFSNDDIARVIGLCLWLVVCGLLTPSFVRCIRKHPRYNDPLFSAALLLSLNRVAFSVQALAHNDFLADCCRWFGIAGAAFYIFAVHAYLKDDRA